MSQNNDPEKVVREIKRKTRRLPPGRDPQLFLVDWLMRVCAIG